MNACKIKKINSGGKKQKLLLLQFYNSLPFRTIEKL